MLSLEQCKKYLPAEKFTDEEVERIKTELYQMANILIADYTAMKTTGDKK